MQVSHLWLCWLFTNVQNEIQTRVSAAQSKDFNLPFRIYIEKKLSGSYKVIGSTLLNSTRENFVEGV